MKGLFPVLQVDLACIRRRESSSALIHIHLVKSGTVAYGRYSCTPRRTRETSSKLDLTLQFPTDLLGWHNYYPGGVSGRSNRITIAAIHTHIRPSLDFSQPKEIAALPPRCWSVLQEQLMLFGVFAYVQTSLKTCFCLWGLKSTGFLTEIRSVVHTSSVYFSFLQHKMHQHYSTRDLLKLLLVLPKEGANNWLNGTTAVVWDIKSAH